MEFWRIAQFFYALLFLISAGIMTIALVTVSGWPRIRGRGLLLAMLTMKVIATGGFFAAHLLQIVHAFDRLGVDSSGGVVQVGYILLFLISLAADGLLMLAFIGLAGALRETQPRVGPIRTSPPDPPKES